MVVSGYLHGMRAPTKFSTKFSMGTFVRRGHDDQDSEVYHGTAVLEYVY